MHKVRVTPVIGLPKFDGWSHVAVNATQTCGVALAVHGLNARNIGRELVATIENTDVVTAADLNRLVAELVRTTKEAGAQLSTSVIGVFSDVLFCAASSASIILKRQGKVGILLSAGEEIEVRQGPLKTEDSLVLLTSSGQHIAGEIKQKLTQGFDSDTIVTSIVPAVHAHADSATMAFGFCDFVQPMASQPAVTVPDVVTAPVTEPPIPTLPTEIRQIPTPEEAPRAASTLLEPLAPPPSPVTNTQVSTSTLPLVIPRQSVRLPRVSWQLPWREVLAKCIHVMKLLASVAARITRPFWTSNVYVGQPGRRAVLRKLLPIAVVVAVCVIALGVWWQRRASTVRAAEAAMAPIMSELTRISQEESLGPVEKREQLAAQIAALEAIQAQFNSQPVARKVVTRELNTARVTLETLSGLDELADLGIFADLRSLEPDWVGSMIDADATTAAILDTGKQTVARLSLNDASLSTWQARGGEGEERIREVAVNNGQVTLLANGIRQGTVADLAAAWAELKPLGDSNREATLIASYGPYIYVLNPTRRNIYRYTQNSDGVSDPIGWIVPGERVALDDPTSLSVDGDVWVGTRNGQITKLTTGRPAEFAVRGMAEPFDSSIILYTKDFLTNLYVLEPGANRIVILQKNGDFLREIVSPALGTATDLVVSETLNKALVVSGSAVFEVPL